MKRLLISIALVIGISSPASAWYDGYGNYNCSYLDPLTSLLDGIFGQPCYVVAPPPVVVQAPPVVVQAPPVIIEQQVPVIETYPVPNPYVVPAW